MKFKPLLLIIPCALIILGLMIFDKPVEKSVAVKKNDSKKSGITLYLVVGNAGSLKDDIGEPVRDIPDEGGEELGTLQYNCCIPEDDGQSSDNWIPVELSDDGRGYVRKEFAKKDSIHIDDEDKTRMKIVKNAISYLGLRFERYGTSLEEGIDCSNFIQQLYEKEGLEIPTTCNEMIKYGKKIKESKARAGDVVYYPVNNGYGHVAIYLADGYVINSTGHAGKTYPDGGVRICRLKYRDREEYTIYNIIDNIQ